jgi:uncharacterized RDD family membrane protein YckC
MSDLLDSTVRKRTVQDGFANLMDRVRHFYVDGLIILIPSFVVLTFIRKPIYFRTQGNDNFYLLLIIVAIYILYYVLLEYFVGFTIGKFLNKTRIISLDETKPSFSQIVVRTFTRLIPFGILTVLSPYQAAVHDLFSKTRVIRIKKKFVVEVNEI